MTNKQLKNLKDTLWTTADQLRANSGLKSTEYAEPILGLIFLRFADVKYSKFEPAIKAEFDSIKGTRMERPIHEIAIEKCGFYLPEEARYDWLLNLPESEDLAKKVKEAMEAVEKYTAELKDTLPKDIYYSVNSEDDPLVLAKLLKNFKTSVSVWGEVLFLKRLKNRAANTQILFDGFQGCSLTRLLRRFFWRKIRKISKVVPRCPACQVVFSHITSDQLGMLPIRQTRK